MRCRVLEVVEGVLPFSHAFGKLRMRPSPSVFLQSQESTGHMLPFAGRNSRDRIENGGTVLDGFRGRTAMSATRYQFFARSP